MRLILIFLTWLLFLTNNAYPQLLTNPSLTLQDIEKALSNPDHLRGILLEHDFEYDKLMDWQEIGVRADSWVSEERISYYKDGRGPRTSTYLYALNIYEYNGLGDDPRVKTQIDVQILNIPNLKEKIDLFLESIKTRYPVRNVRTLNDSDPFLVYSNKDSKIEVEITKFDMDTISEYYFIWFYLYN